MKYIINNDISKPAYIQLYELLRDDIINGVYGYRKKLPSKRLLSEEAGVSVVTVEHAYTLLCEEGYIESVERSGYYAVFRECDSFSVAEPPKKSAVVPQNVPAGQYSIPFSFVAKAMRRVLSERGGTIMTKTPNNGSYELRAAISGYLARSRGIIAEPHRIVIGSGAEYLYGRIVETLGRSLVYAIEYPSYEKIAQVYNAAGVCCRHLALGADGIKSRELADTDADVLHISPYRSFPSGVTATASKRREYIRWVRERDGRFIVEDDFESEFTLSKKPAETVFSLSGGRNVIYLNTFSMTISPALRAGYMVLPESLVKKFEERAGFYSCTVPSFEQYVLTELIESGDFERHINRVRRSKRREIKNGNIRG